MVSKKVIIKNATGLHLGPAGLFCKMAMKYDCHISIEKKNDYENISANGKSVLGILGACIKYGDEIKIVCDGIDEEEALADMTKLVEDGLGE